MTIKANTTILAFCFSAFFFLISQSSIADESIDGLKRSELRIQDESVVSYYGEQLIRGLGDLGLNLVVTIEVTSKGNGQLLVESDRLNAFKCSIYDSHSEDEIFWVYEGGLLDYCISYIGGEYYLTIHGTGVQIDGTDAPKEVLLKRVPIWISFRLNRGSMAWEPMPNLVNEQLLEYRVAED